MRENIWPNGGEREVVVDGWVHIDTSGRSILSPHRGAELREGAAGRNLILRGAVPFAETTRIRVHGMLRGAELEVIHGAAVGEDLERCGRMAHEFSALRHRMAGLTDTHAPVPGGQPGVDAYIAELESDPSVSYVQSVRFGTSSVFAVVACGAASIRSAIDERGYSPRIVVSEARWSAAEADRADGLVASVPDDDVVSIEGGVSSHGDSVLYLTVRDRIESLERAAAKLPTGLLTVETWIRDISASEPTPNPASK